MLLKAGGSAVSRTRLGAFCRAMGRRYDDSELLTRMRINRYRSPIRFASGQSSDLGILNCSKMLFAAS